MKKNRQELMPGCCLPPGWIRRVSCSMWRFSRPIWVSSLYRNSRRRAGSRHLIRINLVTVTESLLAENWLSANERSNPFICQAADETGLFLPDLTSTAPCKPPLFLSMKAVFSLYLSRFWHIRIIGPNPFRVLWRAPLLKSKHWINRAPGNKSIIML